MNENLKVPGYRGRDKLALILSSNKAMSSPWSNPESVADEIATDQQRNRASVFFKAGMQLESRNRVLVPFQRKTTGATSALTVLGIGGAT